MSKRHSEQFKQEAVAYALSNKDKPLKALATSLGVGYSRLDNWMRQSSGTARRELSGDQQRIRRQGLALQHFQKCTATCADVAGALARLFTKFHYAALHSTL